MATLARLALCALVVGCVMLCTAPDAKGDTYGASGISYSTSTGVLSGFAETFADWWDAADWLYCETEEWDEYFMQTYCSNWGRHVFGWGVTTKSVNPYGGQTVIGSFYAGWWGATIGYAGYPDAYGMWGTAGEHFVVRENYEMHCFSADPYDCIWSPFMYPEFFLVMITLAQVPVDPPYLHVGNNPPGPDRCSPLIPRGQDITIKLEGVPAQNVLGWTFTSGIYSITDQNAGSVTWAGPLVTFGVVRVDFVGGSAQCSVGVTARDWQLTNPSLLHPGGAPNGTYKDLPEVPTQVEGQLGVFKGYVNFGATGIGLSSKLTVPSGPNKGFVYFTVPPTVFADWQFNSSLMTPAVFAQKQCGNYSDNPNGTTTFANGFIARLDLLAQVFRHEVNHEPDHPNESHYGRQGVALQAINPGTYLEHQVWGPGSALTYDEFNMLITMDLVQMDAAISVYTGNHDAFPGANVKPHRPNETPNGVHIGRVNFTPYTSAPACP